MTPTPEEARALVQDGGVSVTAPFWDERPELRVIRDFARSRRVSPWALLGVTLARVLAAVPPFVRLPALTGGPGSLNLFVGLVGASGTGKGAAERAAEDLMPLEIETAGIGSGEGIAHLFAARDRRGKVERIRDAVILQVAEIDTLAALADRRSSTLLPELRKAWMGEGLGFTYADKTRRLPITSHSYRLCMVAGIQPQRAVVLLGDADGGTPQRFVWLPATDPDAPDVAPPAPEPLWWKPPIDWDVPDGYQRPAVMQVCEAARRYVDGARLVGLRGHGDPLDAHAPMARLKVAAALAALAGRTVLNDDDWCRAGTVMRVSDSTRARVQAAVSEVSANANRARAENEAERAVRSDERRGEGELARACKAIRRKLARAGVPLARRDLQRVVSGKDGRSFGAALDRLQETGEVVRDGNFYSLAES
jgi:hypothetical protein